MIFIQVRLFLNIRGVFEKFKGYLDRQKGEKLKNRKLSQI